MTQATVHDVETGLMAPLKEWLTGEDYEDIRDALLLAYQQDQVVAERAAKALLSWVERQCSEFQLRTAYDSGFSDGYDEGYDEGMDLA